MGLPIGIALFGLGVASALVSLASNVISMPDFTTAMVAMIGLGVGIDYALFIVTRYRENLQRGPSVEDAVVAAIDTSGRAVLFAGITVIISLLGLFLMGLAFVHGRGHRLGARRAVMMVALAHAAAGAARLGRRTHRQHHVGGADRRRRSCVVGAIVGIVAGQGRVLPRRLRAGDRALRRQLRRQAAAPAGAAPGREAARRSRFWYRWSRFIQHRPWPSAVGAVLSC